MKLFIAATTICLGLFQALPSTALSRRSTPLTQSINLASDNEGISSQSVAPTLQIAQRARRSSRRRNSPTAVPSPNVRKPNRFRSQPSKSVPSSARSVRSNPASQPTSARRSRSKSTPAARRIPSRAPTKNTKRPQKPINARVQSSPRNLKPTPTERKATSRTPVKHVSPNGVKQNTRSPIKAKSTRATRRPSLKSKPTVNQSKIRTVRPSIHTVRKPNHRKSVRRSVRRINYVSPLKVRTVPKHRRVVRKKRSVPYWGSRRVRSRRLTRAYRPCYYCPGQGWSFSPVCNTRASRYYIFSNSYSRSWPGLISYSGRRSFSEQSLAKQVEIAIQDYAELYGFEDLEDDIEVTQEGSIIILSGEVETEEILEDLVAIARDTDGVRYVVTEDVVVQAPINSLEQPPLFEPDDPSEQIQGTYEPELVFTTTVDNDVK